MKEPTNEQYRCGHCGNGTYKLYKYGISDILSFCMKCGVISAITTNSDVTVLWRDSQERGVMCLGWPKNET